MQEKLELGSFAEIPLEFLRVAGAGRNSHFQETLLNHLIGTATVLQRWGYPEDVCLAGLFHSVYGTSTYEPNLVSLAERNRVVEVIGESAERTVWYFSQMDHQAFWEEFGSDEPRLPLRHCENAARVDAKEMCRLLALFWANEVEQAGQTTPHVRSTVLRRLIRDVRPFLTQQAYCEISATWEEAPDVTSVDNFGGKLIVFNEFYEDIGRIYEFSKACPKRSYQLDQYQGTESVLGYPSPSVLRKITNVLGVQEVIDKTDEQSLFGLFRYLTAADFSANLGIHLDDQPWALIVYVSPTVDAPATGIYRHRETGVCDVSELEPAERESFINGTLARDRNDSSAWDPVYTTRFKQNSALLFKAGDLPHTRVTTWGSDIATARITQNFNFQVR